MQQMKLRRLFNDTWLATWELDEPVWAVVKGRNTPSAMLAEVVAHANDIPWRTDAPSRIEVGRAVQALVDSTNVPEVTS